MDSIIFLFFSLGNSDIQWCFSQVKGTLEDDATEGMHGFASIYVYPDFVVISTYTLNLI